MLKSALTKAVAWKRLAAQPLADVKPLKADTTGRIRYLTTAEEKRLRQALEARDDGAQARRRAAANAWRRGARLRAVSDENPDHLTPIVLAGAEHRTTEGRTVRAALADVDLVGKHAHGARGRRREGREQTRYVPLEYRGAHAC